MGIPFDQPPQKSPLDCDPKNPGTSGANLLGALVDLAVAWLYYRMAQGRHAHGCAINFALLILATWLVSLLIVPVFNLLLRW